jgi:hypothetical protein
LSIGTKATTSQTEWEEEDDNKNEGEDYWRKVIDIEQWKEE